MKITAHRTRLRRRGRALRPRGAARAIALAVLALAYSVFAAGLMGTLVAVIADERAANVLNSVAGMALCRPVTGTGGGVDRAWPQRRLGLGDAYARLRGERWHS